MPAPSYDPSELLPFSPDLSRGRAGILRSFLQTAFDQSFSDLAAWYSRSTGGHHRTYDCRSVLGVYDASSTLTEESEWIGFLLDSREILILNHRPDHFLNEMLLHGEMKSGVCLPLFDKRDVSDIVIFNSRKENHYGRRNSRGLQSLGAICSNLLKP